ncbi:lipopolysaccharide biosynthesis protein, partial [Methyloversatilis sp.]|uniref:lipopolysaccharide biosynthesis protein n=1 Tax=Methyloversatilis sp. TaxID=2569862 RepID=UPI00273426D7
QLVRQSVANFIDFFIQSSLVYIDVILLGVLAGATQVGLYQAAMKIVQGLSQGISILVNLILPRITRRMDLSGWSAKDVYLVYLIFMLSGGLLSMGMYFSAEFVEQELLAGKFYGLSELVGGLSIFLFIRYLGAAGGMLLIANGDKKIRPVVMSIAVTLVSISALYFVGNQGALGMVYSMVLTYTFIAASLLGCVLIAVRRRPRF